MSAPIQQTLRLSFSRAFDLPTRQTLHLSFSRAFFLPTRYARNGRNKTQLFNTVNLQKQDPTPKIKKNRIFICYVQNEIYFLDVL